MKRLLIALLAVMMVATVIPFAKANTISSAAAYNSINATANDTFAVGVVIKGWEQDTATVESGVTYAQFHTNFSVVLPAATCLNRVEFYMPDLGFNETNTSAAQASTNITLYNTTFNAISAGTAIWTGLLDNTLVNAEGYYIINFTNTTTTNAQVYADSVCSTGGGNFNGTIVYYSTPIWVTRYTSESVSGSTVNQRFNITTNHSKNNINFTGVKLALIQPTRWYQRISGNTTSVTDTWGNATSYSGSGHITVHGGSAGYLNISSVDIKGSKSNLSVTFTRTASSPSTGGSSGSSAPSAVYTPGAQAGNIWILAIGVIGSLVAIVVVGLVYLFVFRKP